MTDVLRLIQGWVGVVGVVAFGNTISCFRDYNFLHEKLYTESPGQVTALTARMFGIWTFLAAVLRVMCAYDIKNRTIYNLTFVSFVLVLVHYMLECFVYHTATLTIGVLMPICISSVSILMMLAGYWQQRDAVDDRDLKNIRSTNDIPNAYVLRRRPKSS